VGEPVTSATRTAPAVPASPLSGRKPETALATLVRFTQEGLSATRRLAAACALALLLPLAVVPDGVSAEHIALAALGMVSLSTLAGWLQLLHWRRPQEIKGDRARGSRLGAWAMVAAAISILAIIAVHTWFRPGTTIAGGDVVVPNGLGWIGRLFDPWVWGGSTLGEPSELPLRLPWAVVAGLTHAMGGGVGLAQQIWYSILFAGAGLAGLSLMAALGMRPIAALAGALVYLLNPYVITWVNSYDNYIVTLLLLAVIPAALIAAGGKRISVRWSAISIACTAPFLGYAFLNPPLFGMIVAAMLGAPLVVAWMDGWEAASRSLRALLFALPLLLGASAYWLVPAVIHLGNGLPTQFADIASWTWEEGRATIRNAFWLNTHWGWTSREFFPYASAYDHPPLSVARFLLPSLAFSALALAPLSRPGERFQRSRKLRLAVAAATVGIVLIVLSTGTNSPGNAIFTRLYNLPLGWLLREPSRFLMLAALAYAVLVGVLVDATLDRIPSDKLSRWRHAGVTAFRFSSAAIALPTAILVGFPLYTAAFVPDTGLLLPSWAISARPAHVTMPAYWTEMASFADSLPVQGAVLVMPPDDWYQMPYTWYYGTDAFVSDLFRRPVLLPTAQSYSPAKPELLAAVNLVAQSILEGNWKEAESVVKALDSSLILVRRDIQTPYQNHSIISPNALAQSLENSPNFGLVRQIGPLELFAVGHPVAQVEPVSNFTLVDSPTPDLRLLSVLPPNTALVSTHPMPGLPFVAQAPGIETWQAEGNSVVWRSKVQPDFVYSLGDIRSRAVTPLARTGTFLPLGSDGHMVYSPFTDPIAALSTSAGARTALSNGDFKAGSWGQVADCHTAPAPGARPSVAAGILPHAAPGGLPALQLSASADSACVNHQVSWRGGPLLLSMMIDHVQGTAPQICLWETGLNRCASLPTIPSATGWSTYSATVRPDAGSTGLMLYLYADAYRTGNRTVEQYAGIQMIEVPAVPSFAVVFGGSSSGSEITVSMTGRSALENGDFSAGLWGPVADCHADPAQRSRASLAATILSDAGPGGLPALQLAASADSACEGGQLAWRGGPLLLSMMIDHLQGAAPRLCLWEVGPNRCASLPSIPSTNSWSTYRATVTPDPGTTGLTLYLYADGYRTANRTVDLYAGIRVLELPTLPSLAVLANPTTPQSASPHLVVAHNTFSPHWQGPRGSSHVLVDGLLNGWLVPPGSTLGPVTYEPTNTFRNAGFLSLGTTLILALIAASTLIASRRLGRLLGRMYGVFGKKT
jgi:arabinofuranan 3-O-arabinosyltransferase